MEHLQTAPAPPPLSAQVGRHRPDFVARCWPNGKVPSFKPDGRPDCSEDAINPDEGRKSFPSGGRAGRAAWEMCVTGQCLRLWKMGAALLPAHALRVTAGLACSCLAWEGAGVAACAALATRERGRLSELEGSKCRPQRRWI